MLLAAVQVSTSPSRSPSASSPLPWASRPSGWSRPRTSSTPPSTSTVVLAGAAGIYILLAAEFVAVTQVLVYIGAIVVLFLFGIMLTRAPLGRRPGPRQQPAVAGRPGRRLLLLGVPRRRPASRPSRATARAVVDTCSAPRTSATPSSATYVIPFEVASVLLLAALVGAVVIARRD